jgi:hypothetical protein
MSVPGVTGVIAVPQSRSTSTEMSAPAAGVVQDRRYTHIAGEEGWVYFPTDHQTEECVRYIIDRLHALAAVSEGWQGRQA